MSTFNKRLREYASDRINQPGEHKRLAIADAFLDENPELAHQYIRELASKKVADLIKAMCDEPEDNPLPIFNGFPHAITVAPGVVKATANCNLDDLGAGLQYREENVRNARERLKEYADSMTRYEALRSSEVETVGECQDRLRKQGPLEEITTNTKE
jgi:hypothetical protein